MNGTVQAARRAPIAILGPSKERLAQLGEWFAAEQRGLVRFATIVCGDPALAQDLVQEAFVRVYLAGGRAEGAIGAYARRTIVNLSRSGFRRRASERRALARAGTPDPSPAPREPDEIWDAVMQLSPRQRAVIALRYYEDLSERQIADALGMSPGAVKNYAHRAMKHLRAAVEQRRTP